LFIATAAHGETTGNTVLDKCQKTIHFYENDGGLVKDQFDEGWCIGWVDSALSLDGLNEQWREVTKARPSLMEFCAPTDGIPVIQGVRVVVKYLTDHPEQLHLNGMTVTWMALKDAFPCK
jgi:hypothetical protein